MTCSVHQALLTAISEGHGFLLLFVLAYTSVISGILFLAGHSPPPVVFVSLVSIWKNRYYLLTDQSQLSH